jgi:hypothetical protein
LTTLTILGEEKKPYSSSLCSFLQPPVTSSLLVSRSFVPFRNVFLFYGGELLAPRPTPKLEGHPFSAVRGCLFNIFAATLHIWRPSPPSAT